MAKKRTPKPVLEIRTRFDAKGHPLSHEFYVCSPLVTVRELGNAAYALSLVLRLIEKNGIVAFHAHRLPTKKL